MQISLDFYRILGVPTRATSEQLQQAFEDRLQQLPRQEYSSAAIAARKQLIEEAFVVLADPQKRETYDQQWNNPAIPVTETAPETGLTLEISDKQLAGALLLLQEVGDYPQILALGTAYLQRPIDLTKVPASTGILEEDIILALALARLELGREQWQQSRFEEAGDSLQQGLALLEQEQRFPEVQAEIRGDLYKLRPYRILELLNQPPTETQARTEGLALLQAMLDDRDGIDGNQDDQSGLSVTDFLRFIQQLREYLTVTEQQELFEREAARPSAVASYLAVYALIAKGVSGGRPELVERAKGLLGQLADRQDIAIEQGICWLLLGQPELAHKSVLLSQDQDSLAFLRQYSEGAPDLIPGLYLYAENWLQQEVYPYFQDLAGQAVSLQRYFDDPAIQQTLNQLESGYRTLLQSPKSTTSAPTTAVKSTSRATEIVPPPALNPLAPEAVPALVPAAGVPEETKLKPTPSTPPGSLTPQKRRPGSSTAPSPDGQPRKTRTATATKPERRRRSGWPMWIIAFLAGTGCIAGALALGRWFRPQTALSPTPSPRISPTSPAPTGSASVSPMASPTEDTAPVPRVSPAVTPSADNLSKEDAKQLVQSWQTAKAEAMGEAYAVETLATVLVDPALSTWKTRVSQNKAAKGHWKYTLEQLDIQAVESAKGRATIKAQVKETAEYYEAGRRIADQSYTDTYPVRYDAVRQGQEWRIKDMQVL